MKCVHLLKDSEKFYVFTVFLTQSLQDTLISIYSFNAYHNCYLQASWLHIT